CPSQRVLTATLLRCPLVSSHSISLLLLPRKKETAASEISIRLGTSRQLPHANNGSSAPTPYENRSSLAVAFGPCLKKPLSNPMSSAKLSAMGTALKKFTFKHFPVFIL